jgi:integrase
MSQSGFIHLPEGVPDPVTDEELHECLARSDAFWKLVVTLAAFPGLRRAEICGLHREDVSASRIHVINGKGGYDRWVPTAPEVWELVEPYPPGQLLRRRDGQDGDPNWLGVMSAYHFHVRLGMPGVHLHRFRHYSATTQTIEGVPTAVVARNMGHRSLVTTARYIRVSDEQAADAMNRLHLRSERLRASNDLLASNQQVVAA